MSWLYRDSLVDQGLGPEDCEPEPCEPPSEVVITIYRDEQCADGEWYVCPTKRAWPLFQEKAARRWLAYYERKYGKRNVTIDYE